MTMGRRFFGNRKVLDLKSLSRTIFFCTLGILDNLTLSKIMKQERNVLVFHEIRNDQSTNGSHTKTALEFNRYIDLTQKLFRRDWAKRNRLIFTFDDGYKCDAKIIKELIKKELRVILFINLNIQETGLRYETWQRFPELRKKVEHVTNWKDRLVLINRQNQILDDLSESRRTEIHEFQGEFFSINDIFFLQEYQVELGDHFIDHVDLLLLSKQELVECIQYTRLKYSKMNLTIKRIFAVPFGRVERSIVQTLRDLGYEEIYGGSGYSVINPRINAIPRVQISDYNATALIVKGELLFNRLIQSLK